MRVSLKGIENPIKKIDPILFCAVAVLSIISIITVLGSVDNFGKSKLVMQIAMTLLGMLFTVVIANIDYRFFIDKLYIIMFAVSVILMLLTLAFGSSGVSMETANRSWLKIPIINIAVQPSEFIKITFICSFSKHIDTVRERINKPLVLLGLLVHAGVIVGLILLTGDLGVALVYIGIILLMLFCAGLSAWYFVIGIAVIIVAFPFLWDFLKPYQQSRIIYGFQPELDPLGYGMQPLMSREAISQGGFFGKGFSEGGIYESLTASHTDFIFATVCEKFGFVGGFLTVAALVVLVVRCIYLGFRCRDNIGKLVCIGVAGIIMIQTAENLWMCLGLVPVIGITLPFVSCGGSSLLATYMLVGLAHSVIACERRFKLSIG
ncbi:MAG: FtsW/RodA/SpoVE family cell cycle protein [Clostridia bacterium]|nr:FtsW/RodA/SpoVE family cell cycle protein [Clostridia bacterium]